MRLPIAKRISAEKYITGLGVFKKKLAKIKLSANESAFGPSPKVIKEYNKISKSFCYLYYESIGCNSNGTAKTLWFCKEYGCGNGRYS